MSASPPRGMDAEPSSGGASPAPDALSGCEIVRLRAANPGPLTLSGTNTWVVGREPALVVDPGPLLDAHLERLLAAIDARGGLGGVVLTHDHADHSEAVAALLGAAPGAARGRARRGRREARGGDPLRALRGGVDSGHAPDHFALIADGACFTGDAVLGEGSVFISPYPGAMSGYLRALERLRLREDFDVLCPGHGPLGVGRAREAR